MVPQRAIFGGHIPLAWPYSRIDGLLREALCPLKEPVEEAHALLFPAKE